MPAICYDLNKSPYSYNRGCFTFYFSTERLKNIFIRDIDNYIKEENLKLQSKYHVNLDFRDMLMISLYKKVEKRGFKVEFKQCDLLNDYMLYDSIKIND